MTINIYGEIGSDVRPADIVRQLQAANSAGQPVTLRINSTGGDLMGAVAIYNVLRTMSGVTAVVDGVAASAATIIMLGADSIEMPENAWLMVHSISAKLEGTADEFCQTASLLEKSDQQLVEIYSRETGRSPDQVRQWMEAETWFNASDAIHSGFVDRITGPVAFTNSLSNLQRFARVPEALKATLRNSPQPIMTKLLSVLSATGLSNCSCGGSPAAVNEDAVAEEVRGNYTALVAERDSLKAKLAKIENELAGLKAAAATTLQARATAAVDQAVAEGRLAPSLRALMLDAYTRDEETGMKALAELPRPTPGIAPIPRTGAPGDVSKTLKERIDAEPDAGKRQQLRMQNWAALTA